MGSKRSLRPHGRVGRVVPTNSKRSGASKGVTKVARLNNRAQKKAAILAAAKRSRKRSAGQPPLLVAILSVSGGVDSDLTRLSSVLLATKKEKNTRKMQTYVVRREGFTEREVFIGALDAAKVADVMLLVFKGKEERMDGLGLELVTAMREQGLPTVFAVAIGDEAGDASLRKRRGRVLAAESIGEDHELRPIQVECNDEADNAEINKLAVRRILAKQPRAVSWRERYGYMWVESTSEMIIETKNTFCLHGWVRGRGLSANELVHLTGLGSYAALKIVDSATHHDLSIRIDDVAEPVESEGEVDELMGEQTWPPEVGEDDDDEEEDVAEKLATEYDAGADENEEDEIDIEGGEDMETTLAFDAEDEEENIDDDGMSIDDEEVRKARDAAKDNALFPDEVDTPIDQPARVRFARYRGLKSFRTSEWDPKEQLPRDYATLFQFRNLASTRKRVLKMARKEAEEHSAGKKSNFVGSGRSVKIYLLDVPLDVQRAINMRIRGAEGACGPLVASGMLRHENRRSVVHFGLQRVDTEDAADIKAKTHLELHCGFVRFDGRPMFSEHNANSDKHKMERFLKHGRYTVASFYGPAIFAPAPALLCHPGGSLIATGSALGADPDRIMLKRIILTGYPFKTQKRRTVAKFMFFNPEDVKWFKPIELWTKMGRSGHILEPVGTHGHMKCIFDNVILHHDTVCMTLYKRVYPKLVNGQEE